MVLPELDEAFIQQLGDFKTLEDMRANMRERLEHNTKDEYDDDYFTQLTDKIRESTKLEYPPQAINDESEAVLDTINNDLARQNLDFESYLKIRQMDKDTFTEKEIKPVAVKRLERSLILDAIGKAEQIKLDVDEVTNMVTRTLSVMQQSGDLKRYRGKLTPDQFTNALAMDAAARTMNRQVMDKLKAIATETEEQPEVDASSTDEPAVIDAAAFDVVSTPDVVSTSEVVSTSDDVLTSEAAPAESTAPETESKPDEESSSVEDKA
jgi:trigger factor